MILLQLIIILRGLKKNLIEHFGKKSNLYPFHMKKRFECIPQK